MTTAAPISTVSAFHEAAPSPASTNSTKQKTYPAIPSGETEAELFFYEGTSDNQEPYNIINSQKPVPENNVVSVEVKVPIQDFRGHETEFSLDKQAFAGLSNVPATEKEFTDPKRIEEIYYPEVEELVKKHLGPEVEQVVIFDNTVRHNTPDASRRPVPKVHIDQTAHATELRVKKHLSPERAQEVLSSGKRQRIINVWRPINGPVVDQPLALCDSRSVRNEDVLPVKHIYPDHVGETATVKSHPDQKWWYWSGVRNDEVILIKCFDSVQGGRTPHTAFTHPRTPEGCEGRRSIEVRCLVIG